MATIKVCERCLKAECWAGTDTCQMSHVTSAVEIPVVKRDYTNAILAAVMLSVPVMGLLKLTGLLEWSWGWITLPYWAPFSAAAGLVLWAVFDFRRTN